MVSVCTAHAQKDDATVTNSWKPAGESDQRRGPESPGRHVPEHAVEVAYDHHEPDDLSVHLGDERLRRGGHREPHPGGLTDDLDLVFRGDWQRRGKTYFHEGGTFVGVPVRDPINFVSGRIALDHVNGWSISVWGKNLLNEKYYEEVVAPDYNYQGRPRTYGAEFSASF